MARKISWNAIADAIESGVLIATNLATKDTYEFPLAKVPESMHGSLLINGLKQKLADSAAGDQDAIASYLEVWDNLLSGKWSDRGDGTSGPKLGLLLDAFIRFRANAGKPFVDAVEARAALVAKRDAFEAIPANGKGSFRKALMANAQFASIYAEVERERDAKAAPVTAVGAETLLD